MASVVINPLVRMLALGALLFGAAGRIDLPVFWAYLLVNGTLSVVLTLVVRRHPGLLREQVRPAGGTDRLTPALGGLCIAAHWYLAGLDAGRYGWSAPIPAPVQWTALVAMAVCWGVVTWAVSVNPFFSSVVRIQSERGHYTVAAGPYRLVRHPGNLGTGAAFLLSGLALGSLWSIVPAAAFALLYVHRTAVEDRSLCAQLPGYSDYSRLVRYRLMPGVW